MLHEDFRPTVCNCIEQHLIQNISITRILTFYSTHASLVIIFNSIRLKTLFTCLDYYIQNVHIHNFYVLVLEARRVGDHCAHLPRGHAVQVFGMRVNHALLLASMSKRGWSQSASCRLCENRVEDVDHVLFDCPALKDCRSSGWGCQDRSLVLWAERSVLVEAAKLVRVFLRRTNE